MAAKRILLDGPLARLPRNEEELTAYKNALAELNEAIEDAKAEIQQEDRLMDKHDQPAHGRGDATPVPIEKALVAAAGVHYVAFELSRCGYAVGLTAPGVRDVDLLVTNISNGKSINVQVKTGRNAFETRGADGPRWKWRVGKALVDIGQRDDLWVAAVDMGITPPDVFLIPTVDLHERKLVKTWAAESQRADPWLRIMEGHEAQYRNQWQRIEAELA